MTIDEIFKKEEISVRSYNVCKYNNIHSVAELTDYYYKNKSFQNLRNCGRKSNKELIKICYQYQNNEGVKKNENTLFVIISDLTRVQREVINSFIYANTNSLSTRSKNAITFFLNNNLKVKNFTENTLLSKSFNIRKLKNIGPKCKEEIEDYILNVEAFILQVNNTQDEKHLIVLKNKFLLQRTFNISLVPEEILESESIFQLTEFLLHQNAFFNKTQTDIAKKALKLFDNQKEITLDEIAQQVNLSRERVRQIRKLCLDDLSKKLLFISNFNDGFLQRYSVDIESNFIDINSNVVDEINSTNNTNFSREFITFLLSIYLKDSFSTVGNYEDILQLNYYYSSKRHNWNNFYLIKKELALEFDFNSFTNDISNRLSERIEETYSFNFKSYLYNFLPNNNTDILMLLFPICEQLINEEFNIYLDLQDNINFNRNTKKITHEYAYEALEHLGRPSKVKEIYDKVVELHPNYETEEAKIRVSMKRKDGFVPIGRKSVYGLKKWESELKNFKGGTIKDVIIDFLEKQNHPTHIMKVMQHLEKYRKDKDERSVLTNLKVDPQNRFIVYNQSFIGLRSKIDTYNEKYNNLPIQLGKVIISKHKIGYSIYDIQTYLLDSYNLTFEESTLIINKLKYFNEN